MGDSFCKSQFDPATDCEHQDGATTVVGDMGVFSSGDLAFNRFSGNLFLSAALSPNDNLPNDNLYRVVRIRQPVHWWKYRLSGRFWHGFLFGNTLFGLTEGGALITINTTSGAGTVVANTGVAALGASSLHRCRAAEPLDHHRPHRRRDAPRRLQPGGEQTLNHSSERRAGH